MSTWSIESHYSHDTAATLFAGDRLDLLKEIPPHSAKLIVTSPPYNIGKKYERKTSLNSYLEGQKATLALAARILREDGSLCWQVGNHVDAGEIYPLDLLIYPVCKELGLKLRNRIIWHFEHGLHCSRRFSGRYETILWFTKSDKYTFNLDPVRVPQKYPGKKAFKGPRIGQYTCHPLGKNPGDLWIIPNVKHNHVEKTVHPCQFPIELVERLVLSLTNPDDLVVDPYLGVGSAACAAILHGRRAAGAEIVPEYLEIARKRIEAAFERRLPRRPIERPVYRPDPNTAIARRPIALDLPGLPFETSKAGE
ncbi:MAG: site-specific DNA-methyltransferase [Terriglobales bacterium]